MPRPRKPTRLHILSGSAKRHPERIRNRKHEPPVDTCLREIDPPSHLSKAHKQLWLELRDGLSPFVAGESDMLAFEFLVRCAHMLRTGTMPPAFGARLLALLRAFGLTPSTRAQFAHKPRKAKP